MLRRRKKKEGREAKKKARETNKKEREEMAARSMETALKLVPARRREQAVALLEQVAV